MLRVTYIYTCDALGEGLSAVPASSKEMKTLEAAIDRWGSRCPVLVTITKYHGLGGLKNRNLFISDLEVGGPRSRC